MDLTNADFRMKKYRREAFLRYWYAILVSEDFDPAYYSMRYLCDRFELNTEQRLWFCFLYGWIYNTCTAWVVINEFPDYINVDVSRLTEWENENFRNMEYETDTRYKKGKLHIAFPTYRDRVGDNQEDFFRSLCTSADKKENFRKVWAEINSWPFFGRYSTYFYCETLQKVAGLPIDCDSLFLRDISGSKSHRNGLCYALGKDEWDLHKSNPSFTGYTDEQLVWLEEQAGILKEEMRQRHPELSPLIENFTMETALCAYKGFFRKRRYFGFYLDRDAKQIRNAESYGWKGIDWSVMWQCRQEMLPNDLLCELEGRKDPLRSYQELFMETGKMINMNKIFPDMDDCSDIMPKQPEKMTAEDLF